MSTLFVVATPIGNLEDITYRAVRVLGEVDVLAAEDTRKTRTLLNHYNIKPPKIISCRAGNEKNSVPGIIKLLSKGLSVAYVSDAGTPGVSDPGGRLASSVRDAGFPVVPLPGPSAITSLMSVTGDRGEGVVFNGFLSPKSGRRRTRLKILLRTEIPFILYESPYRIVRLLEDIRDLSPACGIVLGREMTKKFEEFLTGTVEDILSNLSLRGIIKGEIVLYVRPNGSFQDG